MLDVLEVVDSPVESQNMLPHETNRDRKSLLKIVETGLTDFRNRMVRFCGTDDRGSTGLGRVPFPTAKRHLDGEVA
jgi:hypothetical protein